MNPQDAGAQVRHALLQVVPDADLAHLSDDEPLRDALELDSLDFLSFVEQLSAATKVRIEEDDYPRLTTVGGCVDFLSSASTTPGT